jgi:charged multivesicular body protein 4
MSGIWGWIGGGAAKKDKPKDAILGLRSHLDMLQKRADFLQSQADKEEDKMRENISSNKAAAKQALVRKKAHEASLEHTHAQILTLEKQINAIETANINRETLSAMQSAAKAMEAIHHNLTVEKVDATMDKLRDQNELSNEVMNAIVSNPLGPEIDEDELEAELEQLQQEKLDEQILSTGNVPVADAVHRMPTAAGREPAKKAPAPVDDEEEELRRLEAEMAM